MGYVGLRTNKEMIFDFFEIRVSVRANEHSKSQIA